MKLTLDIPNKATAKALPLIAFLKTLSFLKVTVEDEMNEKPPVLSKAQKSTLEQRRKNADYKSWTEVRKKLNVKRAAK